MSDTPTPNESRERRTNDRAILPILLIAAGVLLLLGRVGLFDWNLAFGILQLWPLLLIAVGADILTRGRFRAVIVIVTVLVGALLWRAPAWSPFAGTPAETRTIEFALQDAREAEVVLEHGVGLLSIEADGDDDMLLTGTIATGRGERIDTDISYERGVAELRLSSEQAGPTFDFGGGRDVRRWELELARDVPIRLSIDSGVGESDLDLSDLTLLDLDLDAGVGEVRIVLPETGGYEGTIDAGVGEVTLRVPDEVEAILRVETGLGGVDVRGGWIRDGDTYRTEGYDDAPASERISLDVSGGVGQITIQRD